MLTLRHEQVHTLGLTSTERFDHDMVAMLRRDFPVDAARLGNARMLEVVALARARARHHRLAARGAVAGYLCLMVVLGSHFDEDPQLPWAARTLAIPRAGTSLATIQRLLSLAASYVALTAGRHGLAFLRALRQVASTDWEQRLSMPPAAWLNALYPPKLEAIGPTGLAELERRGAAMARRHGLDPVHGPALCTGAMLVLGIGFDRDPLHPSLAEALSPLEHETPLAHTRRVWDTLRAEAERGLELRSRTLRGIPQD